MYTIHFTPVVPTILTILMCWCCMCSTHKNTEAPGLKLHGFTYSYMYGAYCEYIPVYSNTISCGFILRCTECHLFLKFFRYTFYDGPPFATGLPHFGHILAGTVKDIVTRWAHQSGFHVERRFGWDCHGLPVVCAAFKKFWRLILV